MYWAYVLRCARKDAEGKPFYYVGTTTNLDGRLQDHREGRSCRWTSKHGFGEVVWVSQFPDTVPRYDLENDVYMQCALKFGCDNVRGGETVIVSRTTDVVPKWLRPAQFGGDRKNEWGTKCGIVAAW